jgi:hypothetical protein
MLGSKLHGVVFLAVSGVLFWHGWHGGLVLVRYLCLSAGLAFLGMAAAYLFSWPGLLGKTRDGWMLVSSYLLFWPYHLLSYGSILLARLLRVRPFQEVLPGLVLGGRLLPWEVSRLERMGITGVLDLTNEFCEVRSLRRVPAYFCIPLLDGTAPGELELRLGVDFISERLRVGPVYVHCAMGHGRGAIFVAAYLLASGKASDPHAAVALVRSRRPGVRLRAHQMQCLLEAKK